MKRSPVLRRTLSTGLPTACRPVLQRFQPAIGLSTGLMPSIFIATSPVSTLLLSAFPDKVFNLFVEALKTVELYLSWLFGVRRGGPGCDRSRQVCRLMKLL